MNWLSLTKTELVGSSQTGVRHTLHGMQYVLLSALTGGNYSNEHTALLVKSVCMQIWKGRHFGKYGSAQKQMEVESGNEGEPFLEM